MAQEIEGRWLVNDTQDAFSSGKDLWSANIIQAYFAIDPNGNSLRVRHSIVQEENGLQVSCHIGAKGPKVNGVGPEVEPEISLDEFEQMLVMSAGRLVEKVRYHIGETGLKWEVEIDVFIGRHSGLVIAEVEVPTVDDLEEVRANPLSWFGLDITDDIRYSNAQLAVTGAIPQD